MSEFSKEWYKDSERNKFATDQLSKSNGLHQINIKGDREEERDITEVLKNTKSELTEFKQDIQNKMDKSIGDEIRDVQQYYKNSKDRSDLVAARKSPQQQIDCCTTAGAFAHAMQYLIVRSGATKQPNGFIDSVRGPKTRAGINTIKSHIKKTYNKDLTLDGKPDKAFIDALTSRQDDKKMTIMEILFSEGIGNTTTTPEADKPPMPKAPTRSSGATEDQGIDGNQTDPNESSNKKTTQTQPGSKELDRGKDDYDYVTNGGIRLFGSAAKELSDHGSFEFGNNIINAINDRKNRNDLNSSTTLTDKEKANRDKNISINMKIILNNLQIKWKNNKFSYFDTGGSLDKHDLVYVVGNKNSKKLWEKKDRFTTQIHIDNKPVNLNIYPVRGYDQTTKQSILKGFDIGADVLQSQTKTTPTSNITSTYRPNTDTTNNINSPKTTPPTDSTKNIVTSDNQYKKER